MTRVDQGKDWKGARLYTIGHSSRTLDELVAILRSFDVTVLADIRTIPRSRHNPQFNGDALRAALRSRRIRYVHLPELGGLRHARKDSPNTAWRNASFRGYADYMSTADFTTGLAALGALTEKGNVVMMCAEAVPWRCHRSLVADALTVRGAQIEHIMDAARARPHRLTPFAKVTGTRVTYPAEVSDEAGATRLVTRAPFHLEATVRVLQRRPTNLVERWERDRYIRVLATPGGLALAEVENRGTIDAPDVRLTVRHGKASGVEQVLRTSLGLDVDPRPLRRLAEAEPRLRPTAIALRGMRPPRFTDLFETFANVVPFQQVSLDAGIAIVGRMVERFGEHVEYDDRRFHAFPTAAAIADARVETLRACGLSLRKAHALRQVARTIASGDLTAATLSSLSTKDALVTLTELVGIGPWSAALVLLRGLGRLDVFPPGDVGAARGLGAVMHLPPGALAFQQVLDRFGDRRGYLYFCALGGALLARGLIHAAPQHRTS